MTKLTYDLVNVYYKGQESLKKQDNSYFMCLYTMLVVLFILVVALLISSIHTFEPVKKEGNIGKMPEDIKKLQTPEDVVHKQVSKVPEFHIDDVDVSENYDLVLPWKNFVDFFIGEEETTKSESHTIDPSVEVITEFQSFFKGDKGEEEPLLKREKYIVSTGIEIAEDKISNEDVDWYSMDKGLQIIQNLSESFDSKQSTYKGEGTCNTSRCEMTATRMISSINLSTEPCGNFYNFACGGVSRRDKEEIDIFDSLSEPDVPNFLRKFKEFYMSCVNHEDLFDYPKRFEMTKEVLKNAGLLGNSLDLTEVISTSILLDAMPLFEVSVDVRPSDSRFIFKLSPPDMTSSNRERWTPLSEIRRKCMRKLQKNKHRIPINITHLYNTYYTCQNNYSDFLKSVEDSQKLQENLTDSDNEYIRTFLQSHIFPIIDDLPPPPDLLEPLVKRQYEDLTIDQLQQEFPLINWEKFFTIISSYRINKTAFVQVYFKQYFQKMFQKLSKLLDKELISAFLAILNNKMYHTTVYPFHSESRIEYCKESTKELMPDVTNYLYKTKVSSEKLVKKGEVLQGLFQNLKFHFQKYFLQKLRWLDDESRTSIRDKIDSINLEIFQNEDTDIEKVFLESFYENLRIKQENYNYNLFNLLKFRRKSLFSIEGQIATADMIFRHFIDNSNEKPLSFYGHNTVCIPYALINKVHRDLPGYILLAQVGFPLANILGHAFDPIGIKYDVKLNENATKFYNHFINHTGNTLSNHSSLGKQKVVFNINKHLPEAELVAEHIAIRILANSIGSIENHPLLPWISYKFSREKIFFIAVVQESCEDLSLMDFILQIHESAVLPPQLRVKNFLKNSEIFSTQFSCVPSSIALFT